MNTTRRVLVRWIQFILFLMLPHSILAQNVTLAQFIGSVNHANWQLIFTAPGAVHYHAYLINKPMPRLIIEFTPVSTLNFQINPTTLTASPLSNMHSGQVENDKLRVSFDLRRPVTFYTASRAGKPNRLLVNLTEIKPNVTNQQTVINKSTSQILTAYKTASNIPAQVANSPNITAYTSNAETPTISTNRYKAKSLRRIIIVIDPGHGGKDPGATGIHGIHEKNIVLNISKKLQTLINRQAGFYAILTRSGDHFIPLRQRLTIARNDKADMFVAIHADAYLNQYSRGASVFALSQRGATSEAAHWLAQRENQSELMGGVDLADKEDVLRSVLINLSQTATIHASLLIGQNLLQGLRQVTPLHYSRVEQAAFVVLKSPDIPSLLVETGFVSNSADAQNLNSPNYQQKIAQSLMLGITRYFALNPPPDSWLAEQRYANQRYTVHSGDTLAAIAHKLGVTMTSLQIENHLHGETVHIGQSLRIPE